VAWRNNNPGNIAPGYLQGEIGRGSNGFTVFSNELAGMAGIIENLGRPQYRSLNVIEAIYKWAPPKGVNNTAAYQATVQNLTGING
jgi:hypothetical protein